MFLVPKKVLIGTVSDSRKAALGKGYPPLLNNLLWLTTTFSIKFILFSERPPTWPVEVQLSGLR